MLRIGESARTSVTGLSELVEFQKLLHVWVVSDQ